VTRAVIAVWGVWAVWIVLAAGIAHADRPAAPDSSTAMPSGPADTRRIVGVLDVRVDGVPEEVKQAFLAALEQHLDSKKYWLASRARIKQLMVSSTKWTEGCLIGQCLADLREKAGVELALLIALTGSGTSFGHVVTLVRTDTGRVLAQESDRCDVCTVNEAVTKATLATISLLNSVPEKLPDEAGDQGAALDLAVGKVKQAADAQQRTSRRLGIVLTVVGVVAATAGIVLYETQDKPDYALITAAGGGGLVASGLVVLAF
jgi:hypothetical protein